MTDYRRQIDEIDSQLVSLFASRMQVSSAIGQYKKEHNLPVLDSSRERAKLADVAQKSPADIKDYTVALYNLIFELSRSYQNRLQGKNSALLKEIHTAIETTPHLFPESATVACQGVEGAYSQIACDRLFRLPEVTYFPTFDAVFTAIERGECRYGIIPVENSTAGSVNAVYDLMMRHDFRIVRSVRVKIDHNLLARPGATLGGIREVYSHEQAIAQCSEFLQAHPEIKVNRCENTAVAAKRVAESGRLDVAALSSRSCAELYGLCCLAECVQDRGNNSTRFICISKKPEIYPGADRTSLMMVLPHKEGSLYKVLSGFYALGVNLNKLESRPLPDRNFEFMFYFDIDIPVYSPRFEQLMEELPGMCENLTYLGSYSEVV